MNSFYTQIIVIIYFIAYVYKLSHWLN